MAQISSVYSSSNLLVNKLRFFGIEWWKWLTVAILFYTIIGGFLIEVPARELLHETIRNLYFHVPMWWGMMVLALVSTIYGIMYLSTLNMKYDIVANESAKVGLAYGLMGVTTGSFWAKFTWTDTDFFSLDGWWVNDVRLNGAAITLLIYLAYFVLRNSMDEEQKRAKIAAVYGIFAYVMLIVFLAVLPRLTDSLHPGVGGNPAFGKYDLDNTMRMVFYPASIGWILLGFWLLNVSVRLRTVKQKLLINQFK